MPRALLHLSVTSFATIKICEYILCGLFNVIWCHSYISRWSRSSIGCLPVLNAFESESKNKRERQVVNHSGCAVTPEACSLVVQRNRNVHNVGCTVAKHKWLSVILCFLSNNICFLFLSTVVQFKCCISKTTISRSIAVLDLSSIQMHSSVWIQLGYGRASVQPQRVWRHEASIVGE